MKLKSKITIIGTSKGLIIPHTILKSLDLKSGDEILLDIVDNKIVIEKK